METRGCDIGIRRGCHLVILPEAAHGWIADWRCVAEPRRCSTQSCGEFDGLKQVRSASGSAEATECEQAAAAGRQCAKAAREAARQARTVATL